MKHAVIDIGSNSIRLTLYDAVGSIFKVLFRDKIMAGLAGYTESGTLTLEGIECACTGLLSFKETLDSLNIANVHVFATAALRNISNTEEAVAAIRAATGFDIEVLCGKEEALLGYYGAMKELHVASGSFIDIGGASTEIITFEHGIPLNTVSCPFGSLSLYQSCVKRIMPGDGAIKRMTRLINNEIEHTCRFTFDPRSPMVCVGGTARTVLKIAKKLYKIPQSCNTVSSEQVHNIYAILSCRDRIASSLILRLEPDRIHTIVPGLLIMRILLELFAADEIIVSNYGVREGYLCRKILTAPANDTATPKTES